MKLDCPHHYVILFGIDLPDFMYLISSPSFVTWLLFSVIYWGELLFEINFDVVFCHVFPFVIHVTAYTVVYLT